MNIMSSDIPFYASDMSIAVIIRPESLELRAQEFHCAVSDEASNRYYDL